MPSSPSETTSTPAASARTVEVSVTGRTVEPPPATVDLPVGQSLTLVITSDVDNEVHAHGFEVETPVPAVQPTSVTLTGTTPGVFEVELHHPELLLLAVAVR